MAKMGLKQVKIGNWYNSEEYFTPSADPNRQSSKRYFFTGDNVTVCVNMIQPKLNRLGEHRHPHEQFLLVPQGDGKVIIDGKDYDAEPGFFAYCPPEVPHGYDSSEATHVCWNLDIFYPERLEYEKDTFFRILASGKDPMETMITKDTDTW
jgi:quercetin dioxygenase-like cupin family protein